MHFQTSGYDAIVPLGSSSTNLRLLYINFGNMAGAPYAAIFGFIANGFEFDHNYLYINGSMNDAAMSANFTGTGYDQNLIHDNTIYTPTAGSAYIGYGADGLQFSGNGYSVYNNMLISYETSSWNTAEGQHSDGWQTAGGSYVKIYSNFIYGYTDIGLYGGCWGNAVPGGSHTFSHIRIYNNIVDAEQVILAGDICVAADDQTGSVFTDIGVYNNTVRVPPYGSPIQGYYGVGLSFGSPTTGGTWSNVVAANNLIIAPSLNNFIGVQNATVSASNNVYMTDIQAESALVNLQPGLSTSDYHLKSTATSLIGQGLNESSVFTTDKDGNPRPATGAWDIGAYQFQDSSVIDNPRQNPKDFMLFQNFPNPFNESTTIEFTMKEEGYATLKVYDLLGREIETLAEGTYSRGVHQCSWHAEGLPNGVYYCKFTAGSYSETRSMVLVH
jgi:hypothetical protein